MSNSVFKEYPSSTYDNEDENLKIDSNLVIVVNKNGAVSVDQRTLRNILVNKDTSNASVSVVRVVSPTPSLQDEIDEEMKNNTLENEIFGSDTEEEVDKIEPGKVEDGSDSKASKPKVLKTVDGEDTPHVCVTVDHYYPPGEANKFANEVLGLAGISNPLSLEIVDYDFQRYVIQNDHCYTPLTSPTQQRSARTSQANSPTPETSESADKSSTPTSSTATTSQLSAAALKMTRSGRNVKKPAKLTKKEDKKVKKQQDESEDGDEVEDEDSTEDLQNVLEDSDSEFSEYLTSSSEEDDDDSDADFNVNYRKKSRLSGSGKKSKAKLAAAKNKSASKIAKKRQSHSVSGVDTEMEGILKEIEGSSSSSATKESKKKTMVKTEPKKLPATPGAMKALKVTPLNQKVQKPKPMPESVTPKPILVQVPATLPVQVKKDVKKPAPRVEAALFSDMTSLFSTPDIIKKVADKANRAHGSNVSPGFVSLTPTNVKNNRHLLTQQISVQTHSRSPAIAFEQDKQLDLIDSIVKEELKLANTGTLISTPTAMMNDNIPNIVKMLENQSDTMHLNVTSNLLTDPDALPDDLLQFAAAELAANKDLQDIIDTQVLGVQNLQALGSPVLQQAPILIASNPPVKKFLDISHLPNASSKLMKDINRKDPIKIVRSDGRVITLPPIEAPATRASKRRAQNTSISDGSASNEQSPQVTSSQSKMALTALAKEKMDSLKKELAEAKLASPAVVTLVEPIVPVAVPEAAVISAIGGSMDESRRNSLSFGKVPPTEQSAGLMDTPAGRSSRRQSSVTALLAAYPDMDDIDSDESWNSEDDPDRLWCICKQPHNNRFMICCDVCEDWFHGKCVNITKAMGQQMEDKGIEWTCPNCIKKKQAGLVGPKAVDVGVFSPGLKTQQTKLTDFMPATPGASNSCIVCSNKARPNSIYCSDDCIRKHAQTSTTSTGIGSLAMQPHHSKLKLPTDGPKKVKKVAPSSFQFVKNKNDRVVVFEPSSGRCLAGQSAPTSENLKQWLKEHPTFEVVVPGSEQAKAIRNKQQQLKQLSRDMAAKKQEPELFAQPAKIQTQLKIGESKNLIIVKSPSPQQQQPQQFAAKLVKVTPTPKPTPQPKPSPVTPRQPRKQSVGEGSSKNIFGSQSKSEPPIRESVKKTLEEQLTNRMQQADSSHIVKMSDEDVVNFAHNTEKEMFLLFNKDTGTKYRAKYRSLIFNIKDPKNQTLIKKICDKSIRPYDLVRMAPEELASQELAKWRENENKHSLEMIKKSELDLLACAKNYVLKTHKGEEVIEGRETDMIEIDKNISVEDVVTALNSSTVSSTSEFTETSAAQQLAEREAAYVKSYQNQMSTSSHLSTSSSSSKKKNRDKDREKDSHRSRSRDTDSHHSRDRSKSSSKHKSSSSRKRSRERSREHKKGHDRRKDDKHEKHEKHEKHSGSNSSGHSKDKKHHHKEEPIAKKVAIEEKLKAPKIVKLKSEDYNLIDKILESSSTLPKTTDDDKDVATPISITESPVKPVSVESDQEPTSTVMIPTPPHKAFEIEDDMSDDQPRVSPVESSEDDDAQPILWTGNIKMFEVASFHVLAQCVSGDTENITIDLPAAMDIVGRISPETVWEYISKIRKSPNKEILILRLSSTENSAYYTLYTYLESRKRLGVVKTTSQVIKDLYIMPLPSHKLLPSVLLPINGPGFVEGVEKPDLLLGIVVKAKFGLKRMTDSVMINSSLQKVIRKKVTSQPASSGSFTPPHKSGDGSYTPPSSPKARQKEPKRGNSKLTLGLPTVTTSKFVPSKAADSNPQEDMDEPYSPGGSDDDLNSEIPGLGGPVTTSILTASLNTATMAITAMAGNQPTVAEPEDDLQRKMEEINRQIEASKMEIAGIAGILTKTGDENSASNLEDAFSSNTTIPALDRIAIPSNLSEILASIKNVTNQQSAAVTPANETITIDDDSDDIEEYVPTASFASVDQITSYYPSVAGSGIAFTQKANVPKDDDEGQQPAGGMTEEEAAAAAAAPSRLAQLTEAELLSMVPDDVLNEPIAKSTSDEPGDSPVAPVAKKSRFDEPPPPGIDDDDQG